VSDLELYAVMIAQKELGRELTELEEQLVLLGCKVGMGSLRLPIKRKSVKINPSMTIDRGDIVEIELDVRRFKGEVLSANYLDGEGWYIEMLIDGSYRYWSQKHDGGKLISIMEAVKNGKTKY
jgi:hypothetical protein